MGRLGNAMFQYVSLNFNAKRFNRKPCISQVRKLTEMFHYKWKVFFIKTRYDYLNALFEGIDLPYVNDVTYKELLNKSQLLKVVAHNENKQLENMKYWKVS